MTMDLVATGPLSLCQPSISPLYLSTITTFRGEHFSYYKTQLNRSYIGKYRIVKLRVISLILWKCLVRNAWLQNYYPHIQPAFVTSQAPQLNQGRVGVLDWSWQFFILFAVLDCRLQLHKKQPKLEPSAWHQNRCWWRRRGEQERFKIIVNICLYFILIDIVLLQGEMVQRLARRFKFPYGKKEVLNFWRIKMIWILIYRFT